MRERPLSPGYIALKDAFEMIFQHKPLPDGRLELMELPLPIPPFDGPASIVVRIDMVADLSGVNSMTKFYRAMTGSTGILVPGSAGPVRR